MTLATGDMTGDIYYASEEHRNESLLSLSYEDKGELHVLEGGLGFKGKKMEFIMADIREIKLVANDSRDLGDWIRVKFIDNEKQPRDAYFIRLDDEVLMGNKKENTSDLFNELIDLYDM